ncbi:MAG: sel1 repeat family protein [Candidatus Methanofishera endochildressiae]|uniref:Sel1 repeat family protein n=1 Tax=Candidatus Methanofishera endochildressiae TaxID=2738884 RepID=A0A7Z0MPE0_9GAMM|nr:sel1 repeat family protein [Candidatus Methanofishera endochildressiae]
MKYYLKAIKLGSLSAYVNVGTMYAEGEGVKVNNNKAFQYFKEGAKKGGISCYSRMAKLFNEQDNIDNSKKCWKRYFEQSEEIEVLEAFYYIIQFIKPNGLTLE